MPSTREGNTRRADMVLIMFSQRDGMEIKSFKKIFFKNGGKNTSKFSCLGECVFGCIFPAKSIGQVFIWERGIAQWARGSVSETYFLN